MTIEDFDYGNWTFADFERAIGKIANTKAPAFQRARALRRLAYQLRRQNWAPGYDKKAEALARRISAKADELED
jgi:hypothetical protein